MNNDWGAVIVAAGKGTRMRSEQSKQFLLLRGKPIFIHTVQMFCSIAMIKKIVVVTSITHQSCCQSWLEKYGLHNRVSIVIGGEERQNSVQAGLNKLNTNWVVVHDAVRPFVKEDQVIQCCKAALVHDAAVIAVRLKDTVKEANDSGFVTATLDRQCLWSIQTPQAFRLSMLKQAHQSAQRAGVVATDDAMLVERLGSDVYIVEGSDTNIKITTPADLAYAEFLLEEEASYDSCRTRF